ncbi:MAG: primosomal protein N', partial [Dehalococcoidia bacterium]|nr:primosomal protein N' [Dehalococcoidia bacterium]
LVSHPPVKVVDMRRELREGNRSIFSRELNYSIKQALSNGDQVILFINRRGAFTFVHCGDCGFHMRCRRCEVSLVYHRDEDRLVCHQCNYRLKVPAFCPECNGKKIRFSGLGTQRVEQEAREIFRGARLLRWDRDVTRKSHAHQDIMEKFLGREADILIGTQMIAKGLDIPSVNLVGVINADTGLSLADFRAAERTFQLLTQVSGRAGRGAKEGKVVIQTFNPQHYAIEAAARHDYKAFYEKELIYRNRFNYPPFTRLATLSYTHINQSKCKIEVERIANLVRTEAARAGITDVVILGPTPAFIARKKGKYRWQLVVMGKEFHFLLANLILPSGWSINIDPLGVD